ncbi:MAG TPA: protein O-GlcNAcase [Microbacterium sp.]|nr:protein O-GlcNAcase [Microbacterium sp.]
MTGFGTRGIVEGFYGTPWTHTQRLDMIAFLGGLGMNTYVYSPKDDPAVRFTWRTPYADTERDRLRELIAAAHGAGLRFVYALSPGLTVRYGDPADEQAIADRYTALAEDGVHDFGLFFDDIPGDLQHDADRERYPDLIAAQLDLIARVAARTPGSLLICPTTYFGYGDEEHITRLGRGLPPGTGLLWTGRQICSATIDGDDARRFRDATGHRPLYWDNYPVNDVAMTAELHIGPYRGRSADLAAHAAGVIANPMERPEASKIALFTIACYLADPAAYDPDESWDAALDALIPNPADRAAFRLFARTSLGSCLNPDDAPDFSVVLSRALFLVSQGEMDAAADALGELAADYLAAAATLLDAPGFSAPALRAETRPWIEAFRVGAGAVAELSEHIRDGLDPADPRLAALVRTRDALRAGGRRVFGDALDMAVTDLDSGHYTRPNTKRSAS